MNFVTNLSPAECIKNIKQRAQKDSSLVELQHFLSMDNNIIFYKAQGNNIQLRKLRRRNIFSPYFRGEYATNKELTYLTGNFYTTGSAKSFVFFWFAAVFLIGVLGFVSSLNNNFESQTIAGFIGPIVMAIFGAITLKSMKAQAKEYEKDIIRFIKETCQTNKS